MIEKSRVISLISLIAGLLLAVGSMTVFRACGPKDNGTWMNCHNAQIGVACCGVGLAILCAIAVFVKNKAVQAICSAAALVLSVTAFMVPGNLVHMCMLDNMRCQAVLKPFARSMASLIALLSLWNVLYMVMGKRESGQETE